MADHNDTRQFPSKPHLHYRVVLSIGGLSVGEEVRVVPLHSEMGPDGPRNIFVTLERGGSQQKKIQLNMGTGVALAYFLPIR